ncbi:hypothetical protein C8R46DRAFT_1062298 [Mycena filopes]|nr:hypothetical protein C8R46DRAFT_1062298 [Mycena filopes]
MTSVNVTSYGENGLDMLYRSVVRDAIHNSAERPPDPACHPGTRNTVLDDLLAWSQDNCSVATVLWLHGSAGAGKSAIAQDFASRCQEAGILGASFFFKRGSPDRGTWKGLFPTIAYQLATSFSQLEGPIQRAVEKDKLVLGQAMRPQMQKLLLRPFQEAAPFMTLRPIIVLDGLDECEDHNTQVPLLKLILDAVRSGSLPARVLVVSRPEPHISQVIQAAENIGISRHLKLRPDESALADIHHYLSEEFCRIRQAQQLWGLFLEENWPGQEAINHLVEKSSGTFIYATTVVRYIDDQYSDPTEQLARVLNLDPQSTAPLDALYTEVLSRVPDRPMLRRILHAVVRLGAQLDPEEIDSTLQIHKGATHLTLRSLHSLLFVPPPRLRITSLRDNVRFLHASLGDFLTDPTRSMDLCVAQSSLSYELVCSMSTFLSTSPTDSLTKEIIAEEVLSFILNEAPQNDVAQILRNVGVQQEAFKDGKESVQAIINWLERCSPPPLDLIDRWQDLRFVCELTESPDDTGDRLGTQYDGVFNHILSHYPETLFVVHVMSGPMDCAELLRIFGMKWDVLRPLCALRTFSNLHGHTLGGGLLDFISDPRRAGVLYVPRREVPVPESTALWCISSIRQFTFTPVYPFSMQLWLRMVARCPPSEAVVHELRSLDASHFCQDLQVDTEYHKEFHKHALHPQDFSSIIFWLQDLPSPPEDVIAFWEQQLRAVEECVASLNGN